MWSDATRSFDLQIENQGSSVLINGPLRVPKDDEDFVGF
jgi:hypothetical protein